MGGNKDLSSEERGAIIYGYKRNDSYRTIAAHVSCSKSAVNSTIKRFLKTESSKPTTIRSRRPLCINSPARKILKNLLSGEDYCLSAS